MPPERAADIEKVPRAVATTFTDDRCFRSRHATFPFSVVFADGRISVLAQRARADDAKNSTTDRDTADSCSRCYVNVRLSPVCKCSSVGI